MKVSIIIPAYNAAMYLDRAVRSALAQTHQNTEVIIVDNNSTDTTFTIATDWAVAHPDRVSVIQACKQGCSAARNAGSEKATGEWLQFLDADDVLEEDKLTRQLALIKPGVAWVIGGYRIRYNDTRDDLVILPHPDPWRGWAHDYRAGHTCSNLFHRKTLSEVGGWNEKYPDYTDPELHFRLLKAGVQWVVSSRVEMTYIQHDQPRVSNTGDGCKQARKTNLLAQAVDFLPANKPEYFKAHRGYFRASLLSSIRMLASTHLTEANEVFQKYFSKKLEPLDYSIVSRLVKLYRVVGFKRVEKTRLLLRDWFSGSTKKYLKKITRNKPRRSREIA